MKETIEQAAREYAKRYSSEIHNDGRHTVIPSYTARNSFEAGAEWQSKQSTWVAVADKEPDKFKNVLLSAGSCPSVFVGHFNGEDFVVANTGQIVEYFRVLHWMPIPEQ